MKILVLLSGGVDSTTALAKAIEKVGKENVIALSILYGQKHEREFTSSVHITKYYGVEHLYLDLARIFEYSDCTLLKHSDGEIPHESYDAQISKANGDPVSTYVPFRNGLFLSVSASIAISKGCDVIYYGAHSDDSCGNAYPDCSMEFTEYMNKAIYIGSGKQVRVEGPFVNINKKGIVKEGLRLHVPYHLTWSCYEGHTKACGKCGTCIDRKNAFLANGIEDPIEYEE